MVSGTIASFASYFAFFEQARRAEFGTQSMKIALTKALCREKRPYRERSTGVDCAQQRARSVVVDAFHSLRSGYSELVVLLATVDVIAVGERCNPEDDASPA